MLMRVLGRSKWAALGGWMLAICLGLSLPGAGFAGETPVTRATTPPSNGESEIIFNAKVFCSLKRRCRFALQGSHYLPAGPLRTAGRKQGMSWRLIAWLRKRGWRSNSVSSPPQLAEMETKLAEVQRNMVPLMNKQQELTQLVQKKLAPAQGLAQVNEEMQFLVREKATLQERPEKGPPTGPARPGGLE